MKSCSVFNHENIINHTKHVCFRPQTIVIANDPWSNYTRSLCIGVSRTCLTILTLFWTFIWQIDILTDQQGNVEAQSFKKAYCWISKRCGEGHINRQTNSPTDQWTLSHIELLSQLKNSIMRITWRQVGKLQIKPDVRVTSGWCKVFCFARRPQSIQDYYLWL